MNKSRIVLLSHRCPIHFEIILMYYLLAYGAHMLHLRLLFNVHTF